MDQRFKGTMDLETAWDTDWKHTVAKKRKKKRVLTITFTRQYIIYCKTFRSLNLFLISSKMPEQQVGSDAGCDKVSTGQRWWGQRRWKLRSGRRGLSVLSCYIIEPHFIWDPCQIKQGYLKEAVYGCVEPENRDTEAAMCLCYYPCSVYQT